MLLMLWAIFYFMRVLLLTIFTTAPQQACLLLLNVFAKGKALRKNPSKYISNALMKAVSSCMTTCWRDWIFSAR